MPVGAHLITLYFLFYSAFCDDIVLEEAFMKFYSIPLALCMCLFVLTLSRGKGLKKVERIGLAGLLLMAGIGLLVSVVMMFQKGVVLFMPAFLYVACLYQFGVHCFVGLQEKDMVVSPRKAYIALLLFWASLVVSFGFEALEVQRILDRT